MLNEKEGAPATNETLQDEPTNYDNTSELVGQLFRICARLETVTESAVYATYLHGRIGVSIIWRGCSFNFAKDVEANPKNMEVILNALELVEEVLLCKGLY